mgnify:CR=1 FL=1
MMGMFDEFNPAGLDMSCPKCGAKCGRLLQTKDLDNNLSQWSVVDGVLHRVRDCRAGGCEGPTALTQSVGVYDKCVACNHWIEYVLLFHRGRLTAKERAHDTD